MQAENHGWVDNKKIYLRIRDRFDWNELPFLDDYREFDHSQWVAVARRFDEVKKTLSSLDENFNAVNKFKREDAKKVLQKIQTPLREANDVINRVEAQKAPINEKLVDELLKRWLKDYILWRVSTRFGRWQKEDVPQELITMILNPVLNSRFYDQMRVVFLNYAKGKSNRTSDLYNQRYFADQASSIFIRQGNELIESLISGARAILYSGITVR